jgi:hypothetical protein
MARRHGAARRRSQPKQKRSLDRGSRLILEPLEDRWMLTVGIRIGDSGGDGTAPVEFRITLDQPATSFVSVSYATQDDNSQQYPALAGRDYLPAAGRVTFAPGETLQTISATCFPRNHVMS